MKRRFFLAGLLAPFLPVPKVIAPAAAPVRRFGNLNAGYIYAPYIPLIITPSLEDIRKRLDEELSREIDESIAREIPTRINQSLYASLRLTHRPFS